MIPLIATVAAVMLVGLGIWSPGGANPPATGAVSGVNGSLDASAEHQSVYIRLYGDPVLVARERAARRGGVAAAEAAVPLQAAALEAAQAGLIPEIEALGGRTLYRLQRIGNAIVADVPAESIPALRDLPGIASVAPMPLARVGNTVSVPLIGAPAVWGGSGGVAVRGEGITIGIVDTGVDYLHTDFGGSGLTADYDRNDTTIITDNVGFPSRKVAGGYDFAGDAYDATSAIPAARVPRPDPDPLDCRSAGHGTHVAGTAAGYGVNADGSTYAGPWDATGLPAATLKIGPGVAPQATIYSLRVFGCAQATSALYAQAIEWATDPNGDFDFADHLDVVNLSIGIDFGGRGEDPVENAVDNASLAGVIVVASAGNDGDSYFSVSSPAYADRAIAVAATNDAKTTSAALRIGGSGPAAGIYALTSAVGGGIIAPTQVVTGHVVRVGSGIACQTTPPAGILTGRIALIDRDDACSDVARGLAAQRAGAAGVILADVTGGQTDALAMASAVTVPVGLIERVVADRIKAALIQGPVEATIDGGARFAWTDTIAGFSSRGPRRGDGALKPDLAAPGTSIVSAKVWSGSAGAPSGGTSMAAPHVAGAAALLRQLHPTWSVEEIKALAINTALADVQTTGGVPYSPSRQGAGRIDVAAASASPAVALAADGSGRVSLSFGLPQVVTATTLTREIRAVNKGTAPLTYSLGVSDVVTVTGASLKPLSDTVTIPAGESVTIPLRLSLDPAHLDRTLDPATPGATFEGDRHFLNEYAGWVTLTGPNVLKVPFHAAPRTATDIRSAGPVSFGAEGAPSQVDLAGSGSAAISDTHPLVWALQLQQAAPAGGNRPIGPFQGMADLRYAGIGSDVPPGLPVRDTSWIYFGLAAFGPWTTPGGLDTVFEVEIDADADGVPNYLVRNESGPHVVGGVLGTPTDVFVAASYIYSGTERLPVGRAPLNAFSARIDTAPYSATVLVLPVRAGDLALHRRESSRFTYQVKTYLYQFQAFGERRQLFDVSARHSFDPARPAIRVGSATAAGALPGSPWSPVWPDRPGTAIPLQIDRSVWTLDRPQGLLLLHHLNPSGSQAEVIPIDAGLPPTLPGILMPLTAREGRVKSEE